MPGVMVNDLLPWGQALQTMRCSRARAVMKRKGLVMTESTDTEERTALLSGRRNRHI
jgi:hypothetical protein